MKICLNCNNQHNRKGKYCSDKCKQEAYRNRTTATAVTPVTLTAVTEPVVTDLEKCRYCGKPLPTLQKPRKHPGACYECAVKQPALITKDNTLSSRPALEFTGQMTDFEHEHYKPAQDLGHGEFNPVSKLGQDHYGVFDKKVEGLAWG